MKTNAPMPGRAREQRPRTRRRRSPNPRPALSANRRRVHRVVLLLQSSSSSSSQRPEHIGQRRRTNRDATTKKKSWTSKKKKKVKERSKIEEEGRNEESVEDAGAAWRSSSTKSAVQKKLTTGSGARESARCENCGRKDSRPQRFRRALWLPVFLPAMFNAPIFHASSVPGSDGQSDRPTDVRTPISPTSFVAATARYTQRPARVTHTRLYSSLCPRTGKDARPTWRNRPTWKKYPASRGPPTGIKWENRHEFKKQKNEDEQIERKWRKPKHQQRQADERITKHKIRIPINTATMIIKLVSYIKLRPFLRMNRAIESMIHVSE